MAEAVRRAACGETAEAKDDREKPKRNQRECEQLRTCLSLLQKPADEEKFAGLLLVSKYLETVRRDVVPEETERLSVLSRIADAVGVLFLTRLVRTKKRENGREVKGLSLQATLGINILSSLARAPSLLPRFVPILHDLQICLDMCNPSHPKELSVLVDLIKLCIAIENSMESNIEYKARIMLSIAKVIDLVSKLKTACKTESNTMLITTALGALRRLSSHVTLTEQEGNHGSTLSITCVKVLNLLASTFSRNQGELKFSILTVLQILVGTGYDGERERGKRESDIFAHVGRNISWFLDCLKKVSNEKHHWPQHIRKGIAEILSSRVKPEIRISALHLSLSMLRLLGPAWASMASGKEGKGVQSVQRTSFRDTSGHFVALLVNMAAVELQVNLLTDFPEVHLPGEYEKVKAEMLTERRLKRESKKGMDHKRRLMEGLNVNNISGPMPETLEEKITQSSGSNKIGMSRKQRKANLCQRAIVCFEVLDATLHFLCNESWCENYILAHAIPLYGNLSLSSQSNSVESKFSSLPWAELPVENLMPIRRALSDSIACLLTFFNDCQVLGIKLGQISKFCGDDAAAQEELDHLLIAGMKYIGTWMRVESEEHREKILEVLPFLLTMKPGQNSSLADVEGLPYLIPGILEMIPDKKAAEALLNCKAIESVCKLVCRRFADSKSWDINAVELSLVCEVILELIESTGATALAYVSDEVLPFIHIFPKAMKIVHKAAKGSPENYFFRETYNQALLLLCLVYFRSASIVGPHTIASAMAKGGANSLGAIRSERVWATISRVLITKSVCHETPEDSPLLDRVLQELMKCLITHYQLVRILSKENSVKGIKEMRCRWSTLAKKAERGSISLSFDDARRVVHTLDALLATLRR